MWVLSLVARTLRFLRADANVARPSPDGSRIAFLRGGEIWLMRAHGENARRLEAAAKGYAVEDLAWSPDGRRIAWMKSHRGYDEVVIVSRPVGGGQATVILSDPRLRNFCWAPDGRIIYARLENLREAGANIWVVRTDPDAATQSGEPRRLTDWAGFSLLDLSVSADGKRVAFVRKTDQSDVWVVELERDGSRLKAPYRLTLNDRMDWPGGWEPDSRTVLFYSDRNGTFDIFKQATEARTAEAMIVGTSEEKRAPQFSADGNWILYLAWPRTDSTVFPPSGHLMRASVPNGPPETVLEVRGYPGSAQVLRERWLPTARGYPDLRCPSALPAACVLAETNQDQVVFSAVGPREGKRRELARIDVDPRDTFWDLAPDGSRIAFGQFAEDSGLIRILDVAGGQERRISAGQWTHLNSLGWSADGSHLFVTNWSVRGAALLRVALSGKTEVLHLATGMFTSLERPLPSPDGRHLAYGQVTTISNAWMIENF